MKYFKPLPTEGFFCNFSCQIVAPIFVFWVGDFKFRRHKAGKFYLSPKCYKLLKYYFPWNWDHKKIFIVCKYTNVVKRRRMEGDDIIVNSLIHPRCKFWQGHQWPGRDHNWKKVCGPQSSRTLPQQHLLGFWLNNHGWQHQLRNHGQKKFHANQSNVFRYPCLEKKWK